MYERKHIVDLQATQINSIFNLKKKKKTDLRSVAWVIFIIGNL